MYFCQESMIEALLLRNNELSREMNVTILPHRRNDSEEGGSAYLLFVGVPIDLLRLGTTSYLSRSTDRKLNEL